MDNYAHDARMEDAYRYHRPILHVYIMDEYGHVIADIDAPSTADAMAYYLRSRDLVPDATEESIKCDAQYPNGEVGDTEPIIAEVRTPIARIVQCRRVAMIHGDDFLKPIDNLGNVC
jgi:hypothetical protein